MTSAGHRQALLEVQSLSKAIGKRRIVDGVSLSIYPGQVVGLFGSNGAGKTSTFYMIAGIIPADCGRVLLAGEDISARSLSDRAARGINYLAQDSSIFRQLSVYDNILAILEYRPDLDAKGQSQACERLLEEFGLNAVRDSLGYRLSGGERRRTEIARLFAANPRLVLMDEPFSGIDPISVRDTKAIIRQLSGRGVTVLITDHNFRESLPICDYAYIFNLGRIVAKGRPEEIVEDETVKKVYLGADEGASGDSGEAGP